MSSRAFQAAASRASCVLRPLSLPLAAALSISLPPLASPAGFFNLGAFWQSRSATTGGSPIGASLRFDAARTTYLNRTPSSSGNGQTWTWSGWVKRSRIDDMGTTRYDLLLANTGTADHVQLAFEQSNGSLRFRLYESTYELVTTALFRDSSAWAHFVFVADVLNGTASDRMRIYVNGQRLTSFSTAMYPPTTFVSKMNIASIPHKIGNGYGNFDGYLAEVHLIDGQALEPASFGQTASVTGQWVPKAYSGSYGTNGFYLKFADNSTAAALGTDSSGNGNAWTVNNHLVTDQTRDTPSNNFSLPSGVAVPTSIQATMSEGNLKLTGTAGQAGSAYGTIALPASGKWYWEVTVENYVAPNITAGIAHVQLPDQSLIRYIAYKNNDGMKDIDGAQSAYGAAWTTNGDVIGVLYDADSGGGQVTFYKNDVSQGVAATGLNANGPWVSYASVNNVAGMAFSVNHGQGGRSGLTYDSVSGGAFKYTPPAGSKALSTANLPAPAIVKPAQSFSAMAYTGTGATQNFSLGFQPDLLWIKNRSGVANNILTDSVRGAGFSLYANVNGEGGNAGQGFLSDGFSVTSTNPDVNANAQNYVAWSWKKGAALGFDVLTYTGDGAGTRALGHALSSTPQMMIVKKRNAADSGRVYHSKMAASPQNGRLILEENSVYGADSTVWADNAPSPAQFTVGLANNVNGDIYMAYLWSEIPGFSRFGSYKGNGSSDGPFVHTGFRPRYVLWKRATNGGLGPSDWIVHDAARDAANPADRTLYPNLGLAEDYPQTAHQVDLLANGFKLRAAHFNANGSGETYIFAAFAESPFKYANAR